MTGQRVRGRWVFFLAYICSGLAGLVYEVSWTRLLTLYIGHTTAAASAVVAAFLGGLAVGGAGGGAWASRLSRRQSLRTYAVLELGVAAAALVLPLELEALTPALAWAYANGTAGWLFPAVRIVSCLVMIFVPAAALGATFPMAVRWFASEADNPARSSSGLYAANTAGAAAGALLAGFVLIPAIGLSGTTMVGVTASVVAAMAVLVLVRIDDDSGGREVARPAHASAAAPRGSRRPKQASAPRDSGALVPANPWFAVAILGLSGFAALIHEIAWTRILSLVLGPTIYAFAATLAAVIGGAAIGSGIGTWMVGRARRPAMWLAFALAGAAIAASYTCSLAGTDVPRFAARQLASASSTFEERLQQGLLLTAALILPTAVCLGAAFPLTLSIVGATASRVAGRFGIVYAVNTLGAVSGSLAAGFLFIPWFGLQGTLQVVSGCLIAAAATVVAWGALSGRARAAGLVAVAAAAAMLVLAPPWDRALLASGAYMYAPYVPKDLDLETLLEAGTLLYYREGAASTVSVKRLTGTTTLAVDGKVDASNRGDMLTQKLIAHLPLLLHEQPREVGIIGLGSGATLGAALRHPIVRADVIEISPEVVEASAFFAAENGRALDDPRTNLIVGDGRSHLLLSDRQYDVIISEPSNPWIAGVAALFTREFFAAARSRLAPGGIICQWANAYNISDRDLRAIVATFRSVFPDGTVWLVGGDDVLLVGSTASVDGADRVAAAADSEPGVERPIEARLADIERHWARPGVADDLASVAVREPFSIWSLFMGGPGELERYAAGAELFTDDRMTLEFSAPRELHRRTASDNGAALETLLSDHEGPAIVRQARAAAGASAWRNRAAMMARSDVHAAAYDDYVRALTLDPGDALALDGLVRTAVLTTRAPDALAWIKTLTSNRPPTVEVLVAISKLLAAAGSPDDAVETATQASRLVPAAPIAFEQLASLFADAGDTSRLDAVVGRLREIAPQRAATHYYAAVSAFLHGRADDAVDDARRAIEVDPEYAPVYDLIGAAYTNLDRPDAARSAFERSLTFDAHDSTAYTNLGLLELAAGNRPAAAAYFAEALWLDPGSATAREGLARSK